MTTTEDASLIERTLERLAEATDDITPKVYEIFFEMHPEAEELFGNNLHKSRGRMLNEVFLTLLDQANGKGHVDEMLQVHVSDHDGMGVHMEMYQNFLTALRTTLTDTLKDSWPQDEKQAFNRHCDLMNEHLKQAEQVLISKHIISARDGHL